MSMRFLGATCIFLLSVLSIFGQSHSENYIKGKIVEKENHNPVEFINIGLFTVKDSSLYKGAVTNENGEFNFEGIENGNYYLQVSCVGFETFTIPDITVNTRLGQIDIGLKSIRVANMLLHDVIISAEKSIQNNSIDRKVYNVDKDVFSQSGSVSDILQNIPSVSVDIDGTVSMRGTTNITFLINGKPSTLLNKNSAMALQQIPSANIERIEIITNPSAKYKPDGTGGMINIVLKKQKQEGFNGMILANAGNGNRYSTSLSLNYNTGKLNIYGNYGLRQYNSNRLYTDYRISRDSLLEIKNIYNSNSDYSSEPVSHIINLGVEYQVNDKNKFEISGNTGFDSGHRLQNTFSSWMDSRGTVTSEYITNRIKDESEMEWEINTLFEHLFKKEGHVLQFELNLSAYDETEDNHYTDNYTIPVKQETLSRVLIKKRGPKAEFYAEYTLPVNETTDFEAGYVLDVFKDKLLYLGEDFDNNLNLWLKDLNKSNEFICTQNIHALYTTFSHSFDRFSFLAGLRAEQALINSNLITLDSIVPNNYFKLYPTIHLAYELGDNQELQLNYSKRVKRPDSDELNPFPEYSDPRNMESGNPLVKPEQIHSLEFGCHLRKEKYSIIPTVYYRYKYDAFTEIRTYVNDTILLTSFTNLSTSQAIGTELIVSANLVRIANINISGNGYYSIIDASNIGYSNNKTAFSWDTKVNANINLTKSILCQLNGFYRSKRISAQGTSDPSYHVNLGFRQELMSNKASLILTVSDVFNSLDRVYYIDTPELYQKSTRKRDSRIIYFGFTYNFGKTAKKDKQELDFDDTL
ncbi:MAG: TonB-dependent receptor [Mariniphaga sp.]|nr:TonB-dependent receptor [Mariniphaga sp.]